MGNYPFQRGSGSLATNDSGLIVETDPDTVRGPDIMLFLDTSTLDDIPRGPSEDVPALVVEVLSPSDRHNRLIKRIEESETVRGGIIIPDSAREKPQQGEVAAVGAGRLNETGERLAVDVQVGDRILFGKYSGAETKNDGVEYLILKEDEILAVLSK